jgi:hypothetical protein
LPGHRETAASLSFRIAIRRDRAGHGALPKSLIFATAGGRPAPKFLIIGPARSRGLVPQKPHNWRFAKLAVSPDHRPPWVSAIPNKGPHKRGAGEKRFPQILHTCECPGRQQGKLRHHSSRVQARGHEIRFPQKPHSWRIFNARKRCFAAFSRLRHRPASEQGRGSGSPKSFILASVGRPGDGRRTSPDFS